MRSRASYRQTDKDRKRPVLDASIMRCGEWLEVGRLVAKDRKFRPRLQIPWCAHQPKNNVNVMGRVKFVWIPFPSIGFTWFQRGQRTALFLLPFTLIATNSDCCVCFMKSLASSWKPVLRGPQHAIDPSCCICRDFQNGVKILHWNSQLLFFFLIMWSSSWPKKPHLFQHQTRLHCVARQSLM